MKLDVNFHEDALNFRVKFGEITRLTDSNGGEPYEGDYTVTPKDTEQILPTAKKTMSDDVTIKAIPFYKTSNQTGGYTVYIGNEV